MESIEGKEKTGKVLLEKGKRTGRHPRTKKTPLDPNSMHMNTNTNSTTIDTNTAPMGVMFVSRESYAGALGRLF